jgi:hypothetical protein
MKAIGRRRRGPAETPEPAQEASPETPDPSYNPYARED